MSWRWHWRSCSTFHSSRWSSGIDAFFLGKRKTLNTNLVPHRTHSPRSKKKTLAKSAETHLASGKPISVLLMTSTLRWTLKRGRWTLSDTGDCFRFWWRFAQVVFFCLEWINIHFFLEPTCDCLKQSCVVFLSSSSFQHFREAQKSTFFHKTTHSKPVTFPLLERQLLLEGPIFLFHDLGKEG